MFGPTLSLLRFHIRTGIRVSLRTLAPLAAAATAASVLEGDPVLILKMLHVLVFAPLPSLAPPILLTVTGIAISAAAAPRVAGGLCGWIRHMPASAVDQRRAATAGLMVVQTPLLLVVALAGLAGLPISESPTVTFIRVLSLPVIAWASASAALRVVRPAARVISVIAGLTAAVGPWYCLAAAAGLILVADQLDTSKTLHDPKPARQHHLQPRPPVGPLQLSARIVWRALGWRLPACWISGVFVLLPVLFFIHNNELSPKVQTGATRLAALGAIALMIAAVAEHLGRRRPPWPWLRSLPWSAQARVSFDVAVLGLGALPVIAAAVAIRPWAGLPILAVTPYLALRGAAAMRMLTASPGAAFGQFLAEAWIVAMLVAALPSAAILGLALTPFAVRWASTAEREQNISRWHELHHLAAGDSLSWSGS